MASGVRIELDSATPGSIDGRQIRAVAFHDVRMQYVTATMATAGMVAAECTALVVGGGRGLLPRGLALLGLDVQSLDPSSTATQLARTDVQSEGLRVQYRTAPAEQLDVADTAFDIVYCADTMEVTNDLAGVAGQAARALKPGGVLIYDTVNRTALARLIYLGLFQAIPATRIMPPGRYTADRLRRPAELAEALSRHGLRNEDICDFKPGNPIHLLRAVLARRRGTITDEQIPPLVKFALNPSGRPLVTYLGYARKM
jgi:2-polyprenyl-6-hydroxyphenyl methylase/3-demethylubiquinone-9 3-methyltransferase